MVTQRDSQASIRISEAVRSDSTAMRTVAILTLIFLPATFVSVSVPGAVLSQPRRLASSCSLPSFRLFSAPVSSISRLLPKLDGVRGPCPTSSGSIGRFLLL